jgi:hypothetical protein
MGSIWTVSRLLGFLLGGALLPVALATSCCKASAANAYELLKLCDSNKKSDMDVCMSYVEGVMDSLHDLGDPQMRQVYCMPKGTTTGQATQAVYEHMLAQKGKFPGFTASAVVLHAFMNKWPCPKR